MGSHFMDTLYDGGTPGTSIPMHTNNASLVMMPTAPVDISGGKVLHVTFEVDAHNDGRRWFDVFVGAVGDTLIDPGKFADFAGRRATLSGQLFPMGDSEQRAFPQPLPRRPGRLPLR